MFCVCDIYVTIYNEFLVTVIYYVQMFVLFFFHTNFFVCLKNQTYSQCMHSYGALTRRDFFTDNELSYSVHSRYILGRQSVRQRWLCHMYTERVPTVNRIMDKNNSVRSRCACSVDCVPFYSVRSRYILGRESVQCRLDSVESRSDSAECRFAVGVD